MGDGDDRISIIIVIIIILLIIIIIMRRVMTDECVSDLWMVFSPETLTFPSGWMVQPGLQQLLHQ
jgi:hypothetical protein